MEHKTRKIYLRFISIAAIIGVSQFSIYLLVVLLANLHLISFNLAEGINVVIMFPINEISSFLLGSVSTTSLIVIGLISLVLFLCNGLIWSLVITPLSQILGKTKE
ncbi:MAG: hypothetical protein ABH826_03725 [Patescibacteria group bacterium]|nr:hypothetical protein [Patescibacteria group bacterium]